MNKKVIIKGEKRIVGRGYRGLKIAINHIEKQEKGLKRV